MKEITGMTVAGIVIVAVLAWGWNRQEVVECNNWKKQSEQFAGFYLADWQKEQCKAHGVEVPVQITSQK